ncbi:VRR-NUC domain-containing protein [Salmonella enterica]|nr:VRR-NUC domain-containing protein [Salmonella enterica]
MVTDKGDYLEYYERDPKCTLKEDTHQVNCVAWLRHHYPHVLFWHTVNEGKKTITSAFRDEQAGLRKGVSDFVIMIGVNARYPFAAIELKRTNKSGKGAASPVSKEQKEFLRDVRQRGGFAAVAYGFEQFRLAIADLLQK